MADAARFLALDLGASSGRAVVGTLSAGRLELREVHRFANGPVRILGRLHWNLPSLFEEIKVGLQKAAEIGPIESMGVDSWGVDFGLLTERGSLLGPVHHYRDRRTDGALDRLFARMPREQVYATTGLQFMPINTLCQILAAADEEPQLLRNAAELLFVPDLLNYWLTGERCSEYTIASTSQMLDVHARDWARGMLRDLELPTDMLPRIVPPGTTIGPLHQSVAAELAVPVCDVVATAAHDTAAAVAAVPAQRPDGWAYISSGTWSLVGVEVAAAVTSNAALESNFTNEGGIDGTIRLLKNVAGLWLLQESRRTWAGAGDERTYEELTAAAADASPRRSFIDPDDARFAPPGDMPARITSWCREHGQSEPESPGQFARCIFESLALKYRVHIERLEKVTGVPITVIQIVGGGALNELLCQLTADVTTRTVIAGPAEATAAGNIMVQALGRGQVKSRAEIRQVMAASNPLHRYEPRDTQMWAGAFEDYQALLH